MAQAVNMKVPLEFRIAAALAGVNAKEFAFGWAAGVMAWKSRDSGKFGKFTVQLTVAEDEYPPGSVRLAAFKAATVFMQEVDG